MKKVVFGLLLSLLSTLGFGQGFDQSSKTLNVQLMLGYQANEPNYNKYNGNGWYRHSTTTSSSHIPGVLLSYDFGVHEFISVAPYFSYQHSSFKGTYSDVSIPGYPYYAFDNYTTKVNHIGFGARGLFHFGNMIKGMSDITQLDLYGGFSAGSTLKTYNQKTDSGIEYFNDSSEFIFEYDIFAGARWYFSESFAANAEVGFGTSIGRIGVTFKM